MNDTICLALLAASAWIPVCLIEIRLARHKDKICRLEACTNDSLVPRVGTMANRVERMAVQCDSFECNSGMMKAEIKEIRSVLDAQSKSADAGIKAVGLVLAERIDAISARLDAVELACGIREKPKTMGGK